jgi:hypothetical protein
MPSPVGEPHQRVHPGEQPRDVGPVAQKAHSAAEAQPGGEVVRDGFVLGIEEVRAADDDPASLGTSFAEQGSGGQDVFDALLAVQPAHPADDRHVIV